jgi:hypothetical protein
MAIRRGEVAASIRRGPIRGQAGFQHGRNEARDVPSTPGNTFIFMVKTLQLVDLTRPPSEPMMIRPGS